MHNPTRLLLCRFGIVLFCLLPTATVGGWIVQRTSGRYAVAQRAEWERELTSRLGLSVKIGSVTYPSPGLARLDSVVLLDPETKAPVAQAGALAVAEVAAGYSVEASQLVVEQGQLGFVVRLLEDRVLRGLAIQTGREQSFSIAVLPSNIAIHQHGGYQTLSQFTAALEAAPGRVQWTSEFRLPGEAADAAAIRLSAVRERAAGQPQTVWRLDTAGRDLPCALAAAMLPRPDCLGSHCTFRGMLEVVESPVGASGGLTGIFQGVDLDSLVTEHFPHQLSGSGVVKIENATIESGRLTTLRGTLRSDGGAVSHSLLVAAQEHLRLVLAADNPAIQPNRPIPYRRLSLGFHLDGRALSLSGSADATQPGVLVANAAGPLLKAPPQHSAPAVNLLRTLLPDNQYQVPATRQTEALVSLLPVPDLAPMQTASRRAVHVPTRLTVPGSPQAAPAIRQPGLR